MGFYKYICVGFLATTFVQKVMRFGEIEQIVIRKIMLVLSVVVLGVW